MADSDVIGGIENLTDAVSGETPSYEYKNPNTDMMKAISKCIDAATGETGTEYEYDNPNTDVIQKMDELAEAIASSGEGGGVQTLSLHEGLLDINNGNITSDSNYYYSDEFEMPAGYVLFDFGATSYTNGIALYSADSSYYDGFSCHERRRYVNMSSYYQSGCKARLSFAKANLQSVIVFDCSAFKVYTGATPIVTAE